MRLYLVLASTLLVLLFVVFSILLVGNLVNQLVDFYYHNNPPLTHVPVMLMAIVTFLCWLFSVLLLVIIVTNGLQVRNTSYG